MSRAAAISPKEARFREAQGRLYLQLGRHEEAVEMLERADHLRDVLTGAGWHDVAVTPLDVPCAFPAEALDRYITGVGPVGLALREANDATRERVLAVAREALAPFVHGDTVRFTAATWQIAARA